MHNFLIDHNDSTPPSQHSAEDALTLVLDGSVDDVVVNDEHGNAVVGDALMRGGEHFDDDDGYTIRQEYIRRNRGAVLP